MTKTRPSSRRRRTPRTRLQRSRTRPAVKTPPPRRRGRVAVTRRPASAPQPEWRQQLRAMQPYLVVLASTLAAVTLVSLLPLPAELAPVVSKLRWLALVGSAVYVAWGALAHLGGELRAQLREDAEPEE